jgi:hypothetical protein
VLPPEAIIPPADPDFSESGRNGFPVGAFMEGSLSLKKTTTRIGPSTPPAGAISLWAKRHPSWHRVPPSELTGLANSFRKAIVSTPLKRLRSCHSGAVRNDQIRSVLFRRPIEMVTLLLPDRVFARRPQLGLSWGRCVQLWAAQFCQQAP